MCINPEEWCATCPNRDKCPDYKDPHAREEVHGGCMVSSHNG